MQYRKSGAYQKKYSRSCASVCIKWSFVPMRNGRFNNRCKFFFALDPPNAYKVE